MAFFISEDFHRGVQFHHPNSIHNRHFFNNKRMGTPIYMEYRCFFFRARLYPSRHLNRDGYERSRKKDQ